MPKTLIFTGSAGPGTAVAAAAAALHTSGHGERTLLLSLGPAAALGALLGATLSTQPTPIAPYLEALATDPAAELADRWGKGPIQLPGGLARLAADELPLVPGAGTLFGLMRLAELRDTYDRVIVDAGAHDTLLLMLGLPDSVRWLLRLLIGLDRGPGQSRPSLASALLPSGLLPAAVADGAQDARVRLEQIRDDLTDPQQVCAVYVLRPDAAGLAEARLALPAIQLHGLAVSGLAVGPIAAGGDVPAEAAALWPTRPWVPFPAPSSEGVGGLASLAPTLGGCDPDEPPPAPVQERREPPAALTIDLPGLPRGALGLTASGDELVVRIGPYRRHILLPEGLRGTSGIRATREGDTLAVRRRE